MLDILFPKVCPSCKKTSLKNEKLCKTCLSDIRFVNNWNLCGKCGVPFGYFDSNNKDNSMFESDSAGHLCGKCI